MKARLIYPTDAEDQLARFEERNRIALAYRLYEDELKRLNAFDFNSLILETHRLFATFPAIAANYHRTHPYWLIDEFQDTSDAQYKLIRRMAGHEFRNIFAVADDGQIIYQWNGANLRQIQRYREHFEAGVMQLPMNYRCPPAIVDAANRLVAHNLQRTSAKSPLVAGRKAFKYPPDQCIQHRQFATEQNEAEGISREIAGRGSSQWGQVTVLARTRALLTRIQAALKQEDVPVVLAQRRVDFLSPQLRWLLSYLRQIARPLDRINMAALIDAFNRIGGTSISVRNVLVEAETTGRSYLSTWLEISGSEIDEGPQQRMLELIGPTSENPTAVRRTLDAGSGGI